METIVHSIVAIFSAIPFGMATWFVLAILGFFVWMFAKASRDPKSIVNWEDLVVDTSTNRASPYKLGYLIGLIVATWIVVFIVDKNSDKLNLDIFGAYLAYLLGGAGVNVFGKSGTQSASPPVPVVITPVTKPVMPTPAKPAPDDDDDVVPKPSAN